MEYLPHWAFKIYCKVWKRVADRDFTYANLNLNGVYKIKKEEFNKFIFIAKKRGWLTVRLDEWDGRKRVYRLVDLNSITEFFALD